VDLETKSHLVEIVATLKEVTALITEADGLQEAAAGLAKATSDVLPAHIECGVTLIREGMPAVLASTGLADEVLDETGHGDGDGPCLQAIRARDIVVSHDLADELRWPTWTRLACTHGIRGVLSYPFDVDTLTLGALNLYSERPEGFGNDVAIVAMLLADHASLLLRVRLQQLLHDDQLTHIIEAGGTGAVVERAIGIVMAQRGCSPEQALRHLHEAATHLGSGVESVAGRLVQTVSERGTPA
jgi:transcriptional regulator with GAF, ATPase, and Fis domain